MIKNLINLLFPNTCQGCSALLLQNEIVICSKCRHNLPLTNHHLVENNETFKKFYGKLPVAHASSVVYFHKKGLVQVLIHQLKYKGSEEIGSVFGDLYARDLKKIQSTHQFDEIIPVPLHKKRLQERGYNQVTFFGKSISKGLEIPLNEKILERLHYSKTQTKKTLLHRGEITDQLFRATFSEKDHGKHFLLIDDVITSGSTLEACGKELLKIPGAKISVVTIAYAH